MQTNNILITFTQGPGSSRLPCAKLADFGYCVRISDNGMAKFRGNVRAASAPELQSWPSAWGAPQISSAYDVWCLGKHVLPRLLPQTAFSGSHVEIRKALFHSASESGILGTLSVKPEHRPSMTLLKTTFSDLRKWC